MTVRTKAVFVLSVSLVLGATPAIAANPSTPEEKLVDSVKNGPLQKIGPWLANLYDEYQQSPNKEAFTTTTPALKGPAGRVGFYIYATDPGSLTTPLLPLGAEDTNPAGLFIQPRVRVAALGKWPPLSSLKTENPGLVMPGAPPKARVVS